MRIWPSGVENYLFSLKPAPVRWFLQIGGAETDRDRGIEDLRLTAEKGHYLVSLRPARCWPLRRCARRIAPGRAIF